MHTTMSLSLSTLDNVNYASGLPEALPYEDAVSNGRYLKVPDPQSGYEPVVSFPAIGLFE